MPRIAIINNGRINRRRKIVTRVASTALASLIPIVAIGGRCDGGDGGGDSTNSSCCRINVAVVVIVC